MKREVIIVGGGVAGIQTALRLADRGIRPTIVEKEPDLGGKLRGWYHLFPSLTPASEVLSELRRRLAARDVEVMTSAEAVSITPGSVTLADGRTLEDVVRELLRPLLKQWLDENLPDIVQQTVDREVERIARGGVR